MEDPTTNLTDLSFKELTARLASREPIPGGGSAAALAGAMGAALVAMVAELSVGRAVASVHEAQLLDLRDSAVARQSALLDLAEDDSAAYAAVVAARRMPKETEAEREARTRTLRTTMVTAAEVPLRTAQVAAEVLDMAWRIAPIGNPNAVSDAGVAAQLASAAVRGALLNVRINLPYLPAGEPLLDTAPVEVERLQTAAETGERAALEVVTGRIGPS
ncbi:MAG TPA: cyclodeaminase/cyclohydrolase family protein [Candidatus Limnocylindrales bacterium]|nr:cyclodeaminase/cyclohydrolase family protein [Candidatus Limnocylindrales bacterium]